MPDELDPSLDGHSGESPETTEESGESQEPTLLAGKYKSPDDLVSAYKEAEHKMNEEREARKAAEDRIAELENRQQNVATQQQIDPNDYRSKFNEAVFDDPYTNISQMAGAIAQQAVQQVTQAQAAVKRAMGGKRSDRFFSQVQDEYEAELMNIDPAVLSDPQRGKAAADIIYDAIVGRNLRERASKAQSDPKTRKALLDDVGVSEPEATDTSSTKEIDERGREMLAAIGITGKDRAEVLKRFQESDEVI